MSANSEFYRHKFHCSPTQMVDIQNRQLDKNDKDKNGGDESDATLSETTSENTVSCDENFAHTMKLTANVKPSVDENGKIRNHVDEGEEKKNKKDEMMIITMVTPFNHTSNSFSSVEELSNHNCSPSVSSSSAFPIHLQAHTYQCPNFYKEHIHSQRNSTSQLNTNSYRHQPSPSRHHHHRHHLVVTSSSNDSSSISSLPTSTFISTSSSPSFPVFDLVNLCSNSNEIHHQPQTKSIIVDEKQNIDNNSDEDDDDDKCTLHTATFDSKPSVVNQLQLPMSDTSTVAKDNINDGQLFRVDDVPLVEVKTKCSSSTDTTALVTATNLDRHLNVSSSPFSLPSPPPPPLPSLPSSLYSRTIIATIDGDAKDTSHDDGDDDDGNDGVLLVTSNHSGDMLMTTGYIQQSPSVDIKNNTNIYNDIEQKVNNNIKCETSVKVNNFGYCYCTCSNDESIEGISLTTTTTSTYNPSYSSNKVVKKPLFSVGTESSLNTLVNLTDQQPLSLSSASNYLTQPKCSPAHSYSNFQHHSQSRMMFAKQSDNFNYHHHHNYRSVDSAATTPQIASLSIQNTTSTPTTVTGATSSATSYVPILISTKNLEALIPEPPPMYQKIMIETDINKVSPMHTPKIDIMVTASSANTTPVTNGFHHHHIPQNSSSTVERNKSFQEKIQKVFWGGSGSRGSPKPMSKKKVGTRLSILGKPLPISRQRKIAFLSERVWMYNFLQRPRGFIAYTYHGFVAAIIILGLLFFAFSTVPDLEWWSIIALHVFDIIILSILSIEFVALFWASSCISKYQGFHGSIRFLFSPFRLLDLLVIGITAVVLWTHWEDPDKSNIYWLRVGQIFQILRLENRFKPWRLLSSVLWLQRKHLLIIAYMAFLIWIVLGYVVYFIEQTDPNTQMNTIPMALWWSIVTVCTIGYGDVVPVTTAGKIVGGVLLIFGAIIYAIPAGIIATGLALKVQERNRQKHINKRRIPAAKLIQCAWRCYAASKQSTSQATWRQCMMKRSGGNCNINLNMTSSSKHSGSESRKYFDWYTSEHSNNGGDGARYSTLQPSKTNISVRTNTESQSNLLRHQEQDQRSTGNTNGNQDTQSSYGSTGSTEYNSPPNMSRQPSDHFNETQKNAIRFVRQIRYWLARREFKNAFCPYDIQDVMQQYSEGHADVVGKVRYMQARINSVHIGLSSVMKCVQEMQYTQASQIDRLERTINLLVEKLTESRDIVSHFSSETSNTGRIQYNANNNAKNHCHHHHQEEIPVNNIKTTPQFAWPPSPAAHKRSSISGVSSLPEIVETFSENNNNQDNDVESSTINQYMPTMSNIVVHQHRPHRKRDRRRHNSN